MKRTEFEARATGLAKALIDQGKLVEAGAAAYELYVVPDYAGQTQRQECRLAFMAGAEHVFSTIMNILDPGDEPTEDDLRRMNLIADELEGWRAKLSERVDPAQGSA